MAFAAARGARQILPLWRRPPARALALPRTPKPITFRIAAAAVVGGGISLWQSEGFLSCEGVAGESSTPPFDPQKSYYDGSTYNGRVQNMLRMIDTRLLLVSDDELERCQALLKDYNAGDRSRSDEELWHAKKVVDGIIHPMTGEKMFILGRMSAFVLVNMPVAAGMLIHGPTSTAAAVFWQWVNQSNNVLCNYVNRSGATVDWSGIMQSYGLATSVSCSIALGAGRLMARNPALQRFGILVPYLAVISASTANMFFSRLQEWTSGVPIFDHEGVQRGISAKAGLQGVIQTVTTRSWVIPLPLLLATPMVMTALRGVVKSPALLIVSELTTIALCLQIALPLVLAMQPATMELSALSLEPQFHGLQDSAGKPLEVFYANKGL